MRTIGILGLIAVAAAGCAASRIHATRSGAASTFNLTAMGELAQTRVERDVHDALARLPYYGVFDNLGYSVNGSEVTLYGQVMTPALKADAENMVRPINGVRQVRNDIQILPYSRSDNELRLELFGAIYGRHGMGSHALQPVPPIHIIVENGQVTLEGVVASHAEKQRAAALAQKVPGAQSVKNQLKVSG